LHRARVAAAAKVRTAAMKSVVRADAGKFRPLYQRDPAFRARMDSAFASFGF
jgi:hypothetical protein